MDDYGYGYWYLVALNVIIFGLFILFIPFRKRQQRLPASVYLAFIVALYTEMYGFPLTIYVLTWLLGDVYKRQTISCSGLARSSLSPTRAGDNWLVCLCSSSTVFGVYHAHFGHDSSMGYIAHSSNVAFASHPILPIGEAGRKGNGSKVWRKIPKVQEQSSNDVTTSETELEL